MPNDDYQADPYQYEAELKEWMKVKAILNQSEQVQQWEQTLQNWQSELEKIKPLFNQYPSYHEYIRARIGIDPEQSQADLDEQWQLLRIAKTTLDEAKQQYQHLQNKDEPAQGGPSLQPDPENSDEDESIHNQFRPGNTG